MEDEEILRNRWSKIKEKIQGRWSDVTEEELERTRGNISSISRLIRAKYEESREDVATRLVELVHSSEMAKKTSREQP